MRLYLMRHAVSEGNEKGLFQGKLDFPLSERGIKQSHEAALFLKDRFEFERVISSPQKRALQTARIVAEVLNLPLEVDDRIKEISYGVMEGLPHGEVKKWEIYPKWLENPVENPIEGVENFEKLEERLLSFLDNLEGENILIVTHGGIVRALTCLVIGIGFEHMWRFSVGNCSLSLLEIKGKKPPKGKVKFFNLPVLELKI